MKQILSKQSRFFLSVLLFSFAFLLSSPIRVHADTQTDQTDKAVYDTPGAIKITEDIPPVLPSETSSGGSIQMEPATPAAIISAAGISQKKLVLTKGFSHKLYVQTSSSIITWSSDNKKIASVDADGKVTGKNIGSCTITAASTEGSYSCKVSVKKNIYQEVRITLKQVR